MTAVELDAFLGANPSQRNGDVVIGDVDLSIQSELLCPVGGPCPRYRLQLGDREIYVYDSDPTRRLLPGAHAFRVTDHPGGRLEFLGTVRSGPDGLAWTLPLLTAELAELRGPAVDPVPFLYLVDGIHYASGVAPSCLPSPDQGQFGCGSPSWILPTDETPDMLRLPNVDASDELPVTEHGFWLIDPFVPQDVCFSCTPAGAADLIGQVVALEELPAPPAEPAYPADQALNVLQLDTFLGSDPAARAGAVVITNVTLERSDILCSAPCPRYVVVLEDRRIGVYDPYEAYPDLPGAVALRVREDGKLDFLGHVRGGPDGLAWTLPQLAAELPDIRAADRAVPYLYLVDGWSAVSPFQPTCAPATGDTRFGCGDNVAWLVSDEPTSQELTTGNASRPAVGIRLPNGSPGGGGPRQGYWLIDPFVDQSSCRGCTSAGAADLIGRIATLEELGFTP